MTSFILAYSTGEIHFYGAIIEESDCQISQINQKIQLDCSKKDEILSASKVLSDSQLEYLDKEKNMELMALTYH